MLQDPLRSSYVSGRRGSCALSITFESISPNLSGSLPLHLFSTQYPVGIFHRSSPSKEKPEIGSGCSEFLCCRFQDFRFPSWKKTAKARIPPDIALERASALRSLAFCHERLNSFPRLSSLLRVLAGIGNRKAGSCIN